MKTAEESYPCMARNVHPDGDLYEDVRRALAEINEWRCADVAAKAKKPAKKAK